MPHFKIELLEGKYTRGRFLLEAPDPETAIALARKAYPEYYIWLAAPYDGVTLDAP